MKLCKSVRFACTATNAVKKKHSGGEIWFHRSSGERKFFTATSRMRWKKISAPPAECSEKKFSPLLAEWGEKNFAAKIAKLTNNHSSNFNACIKFTWKIIEVSERWRNEIRSCWHAGGEKFEPVYGCFFFCSKYGECGENPVCTADGFHPANQQSTLQEFFCQN